MICARLSKNPTKKYRPVSAGLDDRNQLICLCEGMFWVIIVNEKDRHLIPVNDAHFRLVLRPNFCLEGYIYGVCKPGFIIRYVDILLPHQIHSVITQRVSKLLQPRKGA